MMKSVRANVYVVFVYRVCARARLGMCICARTTARIRRRTDKEHKKRDQNIRRQTNLCMLVDCSVCICACARVPVLSVCIHCTVSAWVHVLLTRVRRHFTVLSYSPESSQSQPCDGDGDGLILGLVCFVFSFILMFELSKY